MLAGPGPIGLMLTVTRSLLLKVLPLSKGGSGTSWAPAPGIEAPNASTLSRKPSVAVPVIRPPGPFQPSSGAGSGTVSHGAGTARA